MRKDRPSHHLELPQGLRAIALEVFVYSDVKQAFILQGIEGQILFALFTDPNGMWRVSAVGVKDQKFESRMKLFSDWCALRDQSQLTSAKIFGDVWTPPPLSLSHSCNLSVL